MFLSGSNSNPKTDASTGSDTTGNIEEGQRSWQGQMTKISDSLAYLFNNQVMSDVQFQFEHDGKTQTLYAHKFILTMTSDVFDAMFNGPMKTTGNPEIVKIEDIAFENFSVFLGFLYTEKYVPSAENVQAVCCVLYAAVKYNIPGLMNLCRDFIQANLRPAELFAIKRMCVLIYPEVVDRCLDLMDKEAKNIVQGDEFLSIKKDELCEFLKRDGLLVPEIDLFAAVIRWAYKRCQLVDDTRGAAVEMSSKWNPARSALGEAFFLIRFPTMTLSEFSTHVIPMRMLTTQEAHDVLLCLLCFALKAENKPSLKLPKTAFSCVNRMEPPPLSIFVPHYRFSWEQ